MAARQQHFVRLREAVLLCGLILHTGCSAWTLRSDSVAADPALNALDRSTDRNRAEACIQLAEQLASRGQDGPAVEQYLRARQFHPGVKGVAHPLAVLYDRQGRIDKAELEYRTALREAPKDADLLNDYGYFLYGRGEPAAAEEWFRKALRRRPDHPQAQVNLALSVAEQGRYEEALHLFEKGVGPAAARHNVGVVLARHGRTEEARQHLRAAAERDPSLIQTQEILASLDQSTAASRSGIALVEYSAESTPGERAASLR